MNVRRIWKSLVIAGAAGGLAGCDPSSVYGPLTGEWTYQTGGTIAAKPAVANGTVYMGSWDGYEYALGESSGALDWRTNLGVTDADCGGTMYSQGITSSPWLQNGDAYLGGGDSNWYALDASNGNVLWDVPTGDNSIAGGHYNWSSPIVWNDLAYVGIASFCDSPLVQGQLLQVNVNTKQIQNVFDVVPNGDVGGTIWTSPVIDPSTDTVFVTTGNRTNDNDIYAQSIVALDAKSLAVKSYWTIPDSITTADLDWPTSPVLFQGSKGQHLVAAANKDGILYAFDSNDLNAGPIWQDQLAVSTGVNADDGGSFSNGVWDGQRLYWAGGQTTIDGTTYDGSIRAIDPDTGAILWQDGLPAQIYGALATANGMVAVPSSDGGLYVLDGATGQVLYANGLAVAGGGAAIFGPVTIADGSLFIGTTDGVVHAFQFPSSAGADEALAHAARAIGTGSSACSVAGGFSLSADCRLTVSPRCVRLGQLPAQAGAVAVEGLEVRATGPESRAGGTVRLYTNGSCAGAAAVRIRLVDRRASVRFRDGWSLPPESVFSLSGSRRLQIDLRAVARTQRSAVKSGEPLPGPIGG